MHSKTMVITGAGSGIGRELAIQLAPGNRLALVDLNPHGLEATAALARSSGASQVLSAVVNVADEAQVNAFAQQVQADFGGVDVLINNAGITRFGDFASTPLASFHTVMDVNFWGVVHCSKAFLPALRFSRGSLVNLSSLFGLIGVAAQAHYCASKFAVRGFTEALRQELKDDGVHVACVHPGGVRTSIASNAVFDQAFEAQEQLVRRLEEKTLRLAPSEAARIIIDGIARRRERILIGSDAKIIDLLQRMLPTAHAGLVHRLLGKLSGLSKKVAQ